MTESIPEETPFEIRPQYKKKSIRSFVIRAGRITDGQRQAMELQWPHYGLSLYDGLLDLAQVFGNDNPVVVEVGFGMGDSLLEMAELDPNTNFVGIEVHPPGVGRLINEATLRGIRNIRVFCADANDVLEDCFADESIKRLQLYFPDPWHKKKHNKRRIVQAEFVEKIRQKLIPAGHFHMATDWEPYAEHMMETMGEDNGFHNSMPGSDFAPRPDYRPITKFEKRGERLGHGVWDLIFVKS